MPANSLPPPNEEQIEALLRAVRPRPGERFYRRMASAPWRRPARCWASRRMLSLGLALLVVIVLGVVTTPGLHALGEQLWRFFQPESQERLVIALDTPGAEEASQLLNAQDFPLTIEEAQQQAGFALRLLPPEAGLAWSGSRYEAITGAVRSLYKAENYHLYLAQRSLEGVQELAAVGPAAAVEVVSVAGFSAEYVSGGWRLPSGATLSPGEPTHLDVIWDAALPQRTLRWQDGEFAYELLALGAGAPDKQALIALAERVK